MDHHFPFSSSGFSIPFENSYQREKTGRQRRRRAKDPQFDL